MHSPSLRSFFCRLICLGSALVAGVASAEERAADSARPNILWLTSEDHGPQMGCYGDGLARTPHIDALAARGMLYRRAWSVAPVCSAARTAIITGLYPSSSGGLHHRSLVGLPSSLPLHPQLLRASGYYCTNNLKEDYNVVTAPDLWDASSGKAHWRNRGAGQPFFAVFNSTRSHESQIRNHPGAPRTDPGAVRLPSYHPDTPEVRRDWALYYDGVSNADADAGARLREIEEAGLADRTIVFYFADHGPGLPRSKRWPGDSGLRVPLVVYFPPRYRHLAPSDYRPGGASDRLVSFVDLAPTVLSLAGLSPPAWLQGAAFAGPHEAPPSQYLFGERGRMDERMDLSRSVTDGRFVYVRHYFPHLSQGQHNAYEFGTPLTRVWHDRYTAGLCSAEQAAYWRTPRPSEQLFDLRADPDEVVDLARSPEHVGTLVRLRKVLREHQRSVGDIGLLPEQILHSRSTGTTPYELARDPERFSFDRILAAADLASLGPPAAVPSLAELTADADPGVRYWAVIGLRIRGSDAILPHEARLQKALGDDSPGVRVAAAEALALFGSTPARTQALETLRSLLVDASLGDVHAVTEALSAIDALGPVASLLRPTVASLSVKPPDPSSRDRGALAPLVRSILRPSAPGASDAPGAP